MDLNTRALRLKERKLFISCIVPVHNEEENIEPFVQALTTKISSLTDNFEIIIIDDGSKDNTAEIASKLCNQHNKLLSFSRNFGKEYALSAGIDHAQGDVAILIDADFQHPIETIDTFVQTWCQGFDMVYGVRDNRRSESLVKRYFTKAFYWFMKNLGEISVPANAGDFRLLDRKVIDALKNCQEQSRFMKGLYAWVGFNSKQVIYPIKDRKAGKSSWHFMRLADLALTGIISFSDLPLRIWSLVGLVVSLLSFLSAIYIILDTLVFGIRVPGYATILTAVVFFGGIQMLSIGILGEYISRIYREVKKRPRYIVEKKQGFK